VGIYTTCGALNQADVARRDKRNRRLNYSSHIEKTLCFEHALPITYKLILLANKMSSDCYSQKKSSKKIVQDFLIGIKRLREGL